MSTHSFNPETIMSFFDDEVTPSEAQEIRAHVAQCAECSALVAKLRDASSSLSQWRVADSPHSRHAEQQLSFAVQKFSRRSSMPFASFFRVVKPRYPIAACTLVLAFTFWAQLSPSRVSLALDDMKGKLIKESSVNPHYPEEAKAKNIQGVVRLGILVAKGGSVKKLNVISGDPLLAKAASDAVWHWKYKPTLVNGKPVEVESVVEISFTLEP
jgi:TonB family protein